MWRIRGEMWGKNKTWWYGISEGFEDQISNVFYLGSYLFIVFELGSG